MYCLVITHNDCDTHTGKEIKLAQTHAHTRRQWPSYKKIIVQETFLLIVFIWLQFVIGVLGL